MHSIAKVLCKPFLGKYSNINRYLYASSSPIELSHRVFEARKQNINCKNPLIITHGLFGSKSNWQSLAKILSEDRKVVISDLRCHGESPCTTDLSFEALASDFYNLSRKIETPKAVFMGHSLGGKAMMTLALTQPEIVDNLIVVDVAPTNRSGGELAKYIVAMKKLKFDDEKSLAESRKLAEKELAKVVKAPRTRQFLLTNLVKMDGKIQWRLDFANIEANWSQLMSFPSFSSRYEKKCLFIGGSESDYIPGNQESIMRYFPKASIKMIQGAGHWVHSEKPHEFIEAVKQYLKES